MIYGDLRLNIKKKDHGAKRKGQSLLSNIAKRARGLYGTNELVPTDGRCTWKASYTTAGAIQSRTVKTSVVNPERGS